MIDGGQHLAINCSGVIEDTSHELLHFELVSSGGAAVVSMLVLLGILPKRRGGRRRRGGATWGLPLFRNR